LQNVLQCRKRLAIIEGLKRLMIKEAKTLLKKIDEIITQLEEEINDD